MRLDAGFAQGGMVMGQYCGIMAPMIITKNTAVTLTFQITDLQGKALDSGNSAYLHGGYDNLFPKVEAMLEGKTIGFSAVLELQPVDAFGKRDESLVRTIPKTDFPPGVKVGGQLKWQGEDGMPQVFNVVKIKGPVVLLDGNHPLAGKTIRFSLKVTGVRQATADEVTHQHAHGEHGHHH